MNQVIRLTRPVPRARLVARLKTEVNRRLRERLQAVLEISDGQPAYVVAARVGRCRQSIATFIHRFNVEGLPGLLTVGRGPGRQSQLRPRQWQHVVQWLRDGPRAHGWPFSNWDCRRLAVAIQRRWRVRLSDEQVRRTLHTLGCALLRPRHQLPLAPARERGKKNEPWRGYWQAPPATG
jgi:transposase